LVLIAVLSFLTEPFTLNEKDAAKTVVTTHTSISPIRRGFAPGFVNYKKGALNSKPQVISLPVASPWSVVLSGYSGVLIAVLSFLTEPFTLNEKDAAKAVDPDSGHSR
jgi:hypothetical protein